ncbi:MAG: hypothetical protein JEZ14_12395 [Marinilabiliaceae bacterium]|nr:hypothetical protein [Marinilabiliaceae bacterium]
MRLLPLFLLLSTLFYTSCNQTQNQQVVTPIQADSLILNIHQFDGKSIETQGTVAHVCGVNLQKMKLKTENGEIIKVIPSDSTETFDKSLTKKRVIIRGIARETKLTRAEIEKTKQASKLLCHVDHTPCKDAEWIQRQEKLGHANTILEREYKKLMVKMKQTGLDYISIVIIQADQIEVIE